MPRTITTRTRPPAHPGGILHRHYVAPLGLDVPALAARLGLSREALTAFVQGRGRVTPALARRLATTFATTPALWLRLQCTYDIWKMESVCMTYDITYEYGPTSVGASVPALPGCVAVAPTYEQVRTLIQEAIALHLEGMQEDEEAPHA